MDRQSAATGGMVGMQAVACGADQRRGQDRHEAGRERERERERERDNAA